MKKGSIVKWTSQSQGYVREKTGKIIEIVPAGNPAMSRISSSTFVGGPRNHKSYVVKVGSKTYWPIVSKLVEIKK